MPSLTSTKRPETYFDGDLEQDIWVIRDADEAHPIFYGHDGSLLSLTDSDHEALSHVGIDEADLVRGGSLRVMYGGDYDPWPPEDDIGPVSGFNEWEYIPYDEDTLTGGIFKNKQPEIGIDEWGFFGGGGDSAYSVSGGLLAAMDEFIFPSPTHWSSHDSFLTTAKSPRSDIVHVAGVADRSYIGSPQFVRLNDNMTGAVFVGYLPTKVGDAAGYYLPNENKFVVCPLSTPNGPSLSQANNVRFDDFITLADHTLFGMPSQVQWGFIGFRTKDCVCKYKVMFRMWKLDEMLHEEEIDSGTSWDLIRDEPGGLYHLEYIKKDLTWSTVPSVSLTGSTHWTWSCTWELISAPPIPILNLIGAVSYAKAACGNHLSAYDVWPAGWSDTGISARGVLLDPD